MKRSAFEQWVHRIANKRCQKKHRSYHDTLICVGIGSTRGFSPPCDDCLDGVQKELEVKRRKVRAGKSLSRKRKK